MNPNDKKEKNVINPLLIGVSLGFPNPPSC